MPPKSFLDGSARAAIPTKANITHILTGNANNKTV